VMYGSTRQRRAGERAGGRGGARGMAYDVPALLRQTGCYRLQ